MPRLFCDFFSHFAKKYYYRVRRLSFEEARERLKLVVRVSDHHIIICNADNVDFYKSRYPWAKVEHMRIDLPSDEDNRRK